jgi:hypothetical protein
MVYQAQYSSPRDHAIDLEADPVAFHHDAFAASMDMQFRTQREHQLYQSPTNAVTGPVSQQMAGLG